MAYFGVQLIQGAERESGEADEER
jgi:hypothetical protein